jgi:polysaccharide export outer membrane protein
MKMMLGAALLALLIVPGAAPALQEDSVASADYRVGAEDVLVIEFFGNAELNRKVRVLQDGSISLPLLGKLTVGGLTPSEAQNTIAQMLTDKGLVNNPQVTIFVEELRSRGVYVQGAVEHPGMYQMQGASRLLDMIGQAGGLSGNANERAGKMIYVVRTGAGGEDRIEIDTRRLMDQGDLALNIAMEPGDIVMVPHEETHRVYVSGAVEEPGQVDFSSTDGITVLQAITAAGGPTERANLKKVFVLRRSSDGTQERIQVNVKKIRGGKMDDFILLNNDTVDVGEHFF